MQSFINAGYTPQEVELASKKIDESEISVRKFADSSPGAGFFSRGTGNVSEEKKLPQIPQVVEKKKSPKWLIISLLAVLGIVIVALILLYIFKDQVFS